MTAESISRLPTPRGVAKNGKTSPQRPRAVVHPGDPANRRGDDDRGHRACRFRARDQQIVRHRSVQCEIALLFLPTELSSQIEVWSSLGYESRTIDSLGVRAWQEAAQETMGEGESMYFKQLRKDRVLRPV